MILKSLEQELFFMLEESKWIDISQHFENILHLHLVYENKNFLFVGMKGCVKDRK